MLSSSYHVREFLVCYLENLGKIKIRKERVDNNSSKTREKGCHQILIGMTTKIIERAELS